MVSIEEIIALQKQDEAAKKKSESGKKVSKDLSGTQGSSSKGKEKEKGITIKESPSHTKQANVPKDASQSKQDGKRKMGEPVEASPTTRQRMGSKGTIVMLSIFTIEVSDDRLVIHPHPLFGPMIPFNKNAPFPSKIDVSLLSNPMYSLKLTCSVVFVPNCQFVMKRNMATNLFEMNYLSLRVNFCSCLSLDDESF